MNYFPGFESSRLNVEGVSFHVKVGGKGPALLLLHGFPQTHLCWRHLAPVLAEDFTVVCPDLKGYGDSAAPPPADDSSNYSKRVMAQEMVALMAELGHTRFHLAGHDRGARVAYRLAMDHDDRVDRLVILDVIPTSNYWDGARKDFAIKQYHWGFLAREGGLPERLIGGDPDFYLNYTIRDWVGNTDAIPEDVMAEYRRCFRRKEVIAAVCADYRAGATIDDQLDRLDQLAGRKITAPLLFLWGEGYLTSHNEFEIWERWALDVRGRSFKAGHFLAEELPQDVLAEMVPFLKGE